MSAKNRVPERLPITQPTNQSELTKQLCRAVPALFVYGITLLGVLFFFYSPKLLFAAGILGGLHTIQYSLSLAYHGYLSLGKIKLAQNTDWKKLYLNHVGESNLTDDANNYEDTHITIRTSTIGWDDVVHYVFMPNYNEHTTVLSSSLEALSQCKLATTHIIVVLAMEEAEPNCEEKARGLIATHSGKFKDMTWTVHPKEQPNEMAGKGSNDSYALRTIASRVQPKMKECAIITVADADSCLDERYFEALTYTFLTHDETDRHNRVYQPIVTHYRNADNVPAFSRVACQVSALFELSASTCEYYHHMSYSTYSASLKFLESYDAWDPIVICEDTHTYVSSYFLSGGRTQVECIFLPVHSFCAEAESYFESMVARFTQARRHAFGICEIPYCLRMMAGNYEKYKTVPLPIMRTLTLLWRLSSTHVLPFVQIIYMITLPPLYVRVYGYTEEQAGIVTLFANIQAFNFVCFLIAYAVAFLGIRQITGRPYGLYHFAKYCAEWFIIGPITTVVIGVLPTLLAVTKLIKSESYVYIRADKPSQVYEQR